MTLAARLGLDASGLQGLTRRLLRYATVSVIAASISMTVLGVLVATNLTTAGWANVIATAVGTVPSFELNRRWVCRRSGARGLLSEIGPFCAPSFAGPARQVQPTPAMDSSQAKMLSSSRTRATSNASRIRRTTRPFRCRFSSTWLAEARYISDIVTSPPST
jgi:hypothetical protein